MSDELTTGEWDAIFTACLDYAYHRGYFNYPKVRDMMRKILANASEEKRLIYRELLRKAVTLNTVGAATTLWGIEGGREEDEGDLNA